MYDLLVLGTLPGTNLQITFNDVLLFIGLTSLIYIYALRIGLTITAGQNFSQRLNSRVQGFVRKPKAYQLTQAASDRFQSVVDRLIG